MPKIIMLKGNIASGKTSWAKEQLSKGGYIRVSKDDIRPTLGKWNERKERLVVKIENELIRTGIREGKNVIVDDTNLNPVHERRLIDLAQELGVALTINDSFLKVPPEECIKRDLHRGDKAVGANAIWEQYYKWIRPYRVKIKYASDKPRAIICDIDGTLALNTSGRSYYDMTSVEKDYIDPLMGMVIDSLYNYGVEKDGNPYPRIILVSGRDETAREATERWLENNMVPFDDLFMRATGDTRKDSIVKEEIYYNEIEPYYTIIGVFDDRNSTCRMWRQLGLRVAQLGNPDINF